MTVFTFKQCEFTTHSSESKAGHHCNYRAAFLGSLKSHISVHHNPGSPLPSPPKKFVGVGHGENVGPFVRGVGRCPADVDPTVYPDLWPSNDPHNQSGKSTSYPGMGIQFHMEFSVFQFHSQSSFWTEKFHIPNPNPVIVI